jgi:ribosomal protein S12 methylthiotransferase accessory factor
MPCDTYRTIIFCGPSISHASAATIAPHAQFRPPIKRSDLDEIDPPSLVAIVDGVFDTERAVSPREIRQAIRRGVRVVGASSMGALRAVEVPEMIGVGRVYEMYRGGQIARDDEVAVLLDRDTDRALTEPLVNVRFAVERLVAEGSLEPGAGQAIVDAASRLHFHDRTYRNILALRRRWGQRDRAGGARARRGARSRDAPHDPELRAP